MATLKESIYAFLHADAQSAAAGSLGVLLDYNVATKPQCVFYQNPPKEPDLPLITYSFVASTIDEGTFNPQNQFLAITIWGSSLELTQVGNRVYDLLHKNADAFTGLDDVSVQQILFDGDGVELYDPDLKCYYKQRRFRIICSVI